MHAISSYHGNPQTNENTDRGDYNTLRRSFTSTQCNKLYQEATINIQSEH